jgi:hypothetical protein
VDLGFIAEQLKHSICQSTLYIYNALGVRPLGISGLMYIRKSNVLDVVMWENSSLGKLIIVDIIKEELELLTLMQKM